MLSENITTIDQTFLQNIEERRKADIIETLM